MQRYDREFTGVRFCIYCECGNINFDRLAESTLETKTEVFLKAVF